jgi:Transposase, Mutator family
VTLDALVVKCREGGRTVNACVVHAVGVNRDGFRESLGLDVVTAEDGAAWPAFVCGLVACGLAGVKLVSSDAHPGVVDAIAATLPGACWQRCRTHRGGRPRPARLHRLPEGALAPALEQQLARAAKQDTFAAMLDADLAAGDWYIVPTVRADAVLSPLVIGRDDRDEPTIEQAQELGRVPVSSGEKLSASPRPRSEYSA